MDSRRFDILPLGNGWIVGTGRANEQGFLLEQQAIDAAVTEARHCQAAGAQVMVYLWSGGSSTLIYSGHEGEPVSGQVAL